MKAREILSQSLKVKCKLDCTIEQIQELKDLAVRITPILQGVPTVSNSCKSKLETAIVNLQEQSEVLSEEVLSYLAIRARISETITAVRNEDEQLILRYRYLAFKKWRIIAGAMNVSLRQVYQIHEQALQSFEKVYDCCESKCS